MPVRRMTVAKLIDILKEHDPNTIVVTRGHDHSFNDISVTTDYAIDVLETRLYEAYDEEDKFNVVVIE